MRRSLDETSLRIEPLPMPCAAKRLQCALEFLSIDFDFHAAIIMTSNETGVDMTEAIRLCINLDPDCKEILTFIGRREDLRFDRDKNGRWTCAEPLPNKEEDT